MKLKDGFVTQEMGGEQIMVATGAARFSGLVRSNATAAFIVDCLKEETTRDAIVEKMLARYDASSELICADVDMVLAKLRSIDALDE
jgi:hypothetical protein